MLQARACARILILALAIMLGRHTIAQDEPPRDEIRKIQHLGEASVEDEYQLDMTAPRDGDAPTPAPAEIEKAPEPQTDSGFEHEMAIEHHLAEGIRAEQEGRIDQPDDDSAWFHYGAALDLDPDSLAASEGLQRVQQAMIDQAMEFARDMDFDAATQVIEEASRVRADQTAIDQAYQAVTDIRVEHAAALESAAVEAMDTGDFSRAERVLIELIALGGMEVTVNQLRRRMEEARVYGGFRPGQAIRDHFLNQATWAPETIVVLAGSFVMGSSAFEDGRSDHEGPEHRVAFRRGFAIGRTEVTVAEFRVFVDRTRYKTDAERHGDSHVYDPRSGRLSQRDGIYWEMDYEGREAREDEPVVHVSWNDASAYLRWLADGTGKVYRLPTESEFEYALRGGRATRYWWGDGSPSRVVENLTGQGDSSRNQREWSTYFAGYTDRHWGPAPVASFEPNPFGLYDIGGNVGEWVMDCWHETYLRAPVDGSAWVNPGCKLRVIRGGHWAGSPNQARSAHRSSANPERRDARIGFRVARDL